ncbi:hypothetical protein F5887DRAFT_965302 [Amanita rubescens]|nr:hypothetical protein F5887DRAFT_965302 [Amanita rubescens]
MTSLGKTWGCDPRSLLGFIEKGRTDIQIEKEYRTRAPAAVKRSEDMLLAIEQNAVDRTIPRAVVPTKTICRVLGEALQESLGQHSQTRSAAGYIYEHLFHCYFAAGKPIQCKWIQPRKRTSEAIQLTDLSNVIPSTWRALTTREPPFFWVAPQGAPGIDSALVLEKHILVFQLTIRKYENTCLLDCGTLRGK